MNIIGEGIASEIASQVEQRQQRYGSGYYNGVSSNSLRTPEELIYLNANTSWCKLVSSVDITSLASVKNEGIKSLGLVGSNLAKTFILFNGTDNNNQKGLNSGIDTTASLLGNSSVYGIGGTELGLRPMMGIQSAEVKSINRGSIRRASIRIKAWNKIQFDIIDILYLRLGFNILLEWGHSMYFKNNGELEKGDNYNSLANDFLNGNSTYDQFLSKIQNHRISSNGNYDAMFGRVVNYHWSFQKDGSYDITLDLISIGDVIESFKINILSKGYADTQTKENEETGEEEVVPPEELTDKQLIYLWKNQNTIAEWFASLITPSSQEIIKTEVEKATQQAYVAETTGAEAAAIRKRAETEIQKSLLGGGISDEESIRLDINARKFFSNTTK